jgi:hypothetical protein
VNSDQAFAMRAIDQDLLNAARRGVECSDVLEQLATMGLRELQEALRDEDHRRAFWINVYNAFAILLLRERPVDLRDPATRLAHFGRTHFRVAGEQVSLNTIEHGLLRAGRVWWSFGYLRDPLPSAFAKALRVPLDPRIHFALNCGAVSCPPIAHYSGAQLHEQLELATAGFLEQSTRYDGPSNTVEVSALFNWYRADFGGRAGTIALLERHGMVPATMQPRIRFAPYDWTTTPALVPTP